MYSKTVLEHLENPRNVGEMPHATARGEAENPVCGDVLHLYLKIQSDRILAASFKARGCPPTLAAGSLLTDLITGLTVGEARNLTPRDIDIALEQLPKNKQHCSVLAIDALTAALADPHFNVI